MGDGRSPDGWSLHDAEQRRAWLRLSARQRLDWLWEAQAFARRAQEAARRRRGAARTGGAAPDPDPDPSDPA